MSPGKKDGCHVNVYVRSRPLHSDDPSETSSLLFPDVNKIIVQDAKHDTIYKFDHVFPLDSSNDEVCKVVCEPLVSTVFAGNNGSFLVYGQTGAGKTHTVLYKGGVIPTTIEHLFDIIENSTHSTYKVFLSYLQIYQERIYDLLLNEQKGPLTLREHPKEGIIVEGLCEEEVTSTTNAKQLIETGQKKLIVTHTQASPFSSRSHAVCILKVCKYFTYSQIVSDVPSQVPPEQVTTSPVQYECGKLHICDLAGTERSTKLSSSSGRRLAESRHINTSLLELGNVIHALSTKSNPYIPFRNSVLTRILQESLGGDSKASLMVCISASSRDLKETKCSLNFGQRAMKVMKETIANNEPQIDPAWLTNSFTKKKLKKTDYKILSKYLTSKLKELELAYRLEKENLDALKKKKGDSSEETPGDSLKEELKRTLGVVAEELGLQENITCKSVDAGMNTDGFDTLLCGLQPTLNNGRCSTGTSQTDLDTYVRDNETETEHITVNETMSEHIIINHVFNPADASFEMADATVAEGIKYIDQSTGMDSSESDPPKNIETQTSPIHHCTTSVGEDTEMMLVEQNTQIGSGIQDTKIPITKNTQTTFGEQTTQTISVGEDTEVATIGISTNDDASKDTCGEDLSRFEKEINMGLGNALFGETPLSTVGRESAGIVILPYGHNGYLCDHEENRSARRLSFDNSAVKHEMHEKTDYNSSEDIEQNKKYFCNDEADVITEMHCTEQSEKILLNSAMHPNNTEQTMCLEKQEKEHFCNDKIENNEEKQPKEHFCNDKIENKEEKQPKEHFCNDKTENGETNSETMDYIIDIQYIEKEDETCLCNDETDSGIMEDTPYSSQEIHTENHSCKNSADGIMDDLHSIKDHIFCLEQSESQLCNDNLVENNMDNEQSHKLVELNNDNIIDCIMEGTMDVKETEKHVDNEDDEIVVDLKDSEQLSNVANIINDNTSVEVIHLGESNDDSVMYGNDIVSKYFENHEILPKIGSNTTVDLEDLLSKEASINEKDIIVGEIELNNIINGSITSDILADKGEREIYAGIVDNDITNCHFDDVTESDIIAQEDLKEQFVDQLCSYIWDKMDLDLVEADNIDVTKNTSEKEIDYFTDVSHDNTAIDDIVDSEKYLNLDTSNNKFREINDSITEIKGSDVSEVTFTNNTEESTNVAVLNDINNNHIGEINNTSAKKGVNVADINDNNITEILVNDITIKFNNKVDASPCKRERSVQTDESCIGVVQQITEQQGSIAQAMLKKQYSSDDEKEKFINRFCYSASQHLPCDADFEYREAKCMTTTEDHQDGLYQGCLVYLNDTDSVSDYSEISEDGSLFSDFTKVDSEDISETLQAKLLMENIKNKYEMLLNDFEMVTSERSRLQGSNTRKLSCIDLLTNFKSALEDELCKLGEHSGRSSSMSDGILSRSFSPPQQCNQPLRSSRDLLLQTASLGTEEAIRSSSRPFKPIHIKRTSPDGAQQKTPTKNLDVISFDENNNNTRTEGQDTSPCLKEKKISKKRNLSIDKQSDNLSNRYSSGNNTPTSPLRCMSASETRRTYSSPLDLTPYRSLSLQETPSDDTVLATTEHDKLKRELMLTKLEKSRLEAVLSCILLTNDIDLDSDMNLKNLTMSRSTLSSSTSMAQISKGSHTGSSSPFQNIPFPLKNYNYKERQFATPDSLPVISNLSQRTRPGTRNRTRSIPREVDVDVDSWLNKDSATSTAEFSQDGSTISPCSSFAEITSMSDMETPFSSTQQLHTLSSNEKKLLEGLSLDKDLDDDDMDNLLEQLQKKEKFPLACVPFIKRRSIRKKLKKAKRLCESQSSGTS